MIAAPPPSPPAVETLTVQPANGRWRVTSSDGLFEGVFTDAKSAVQCAKAEVEAHPGHVVVLRGAQFPSPLVGEGGPQGRMRGRADM